jgi:uncharacterized protein YggE
MNYRSFTFAAALIGMSALSMPALAAESLQSTLSISATGTVSAKPDQATIRFGVHSTSDRAATAMKANQAAMTSAFNVLVDAGVDPDDVATSSLSLNPRYAHYQKNDGNTPPAISGYEAHNNVQVTVRDLDNLGVVLDNLVGGGVNGIDSVSFQISDTSALEKEARIQAARKAREMAITYSEAIGTELDGIISMNEVTGHEPQPYAMMEMARASSGTPVAAGVQDVSVTVNVVFGLDGKLD